ncbi:phosphodiester glycosidase family protein [Paenibacillus oceani]|uniref:N-acetylmuramoyl-L-alanine amidase n=1 Tax=Paenibacillus oceani TaxID=2772510 RepID=A0A927GZL4_9BACL|nr:N-acetylmuramoyl-L-alanine amidase [Paenibacillus oceani]MBD2861589.1 N-acetylmuramoyl-L-alanine amidase [Paenibacillus oceani]
MWREELIPINPITRPGTPLRLVRNIVIHYTGNPGASAANHVRYFGKTLPASKERYASAHYFVDPGDAVLIIPLAELAYHASQANPYSIGVEMCIEKDGSFHPETVRRTVAIVAELCRRYELNPLRDVIRHYDVTGKHCPAHYVDDPGAWEDFRQAVEKAIKSKEVYVPVNRPTVIKERIIARDGMLEYLPFNYNKPGTDVRLLKIERGKAKFKLVARPDAKVSELVKEHDADFGINFPYFDPSAKLPVGTVWDGTKYVNGAWGKTHKWHFLAFKDGCAEIRLPGSAVHDSDCAFSGSPLLVSNGRAAWDYYREVEETATDIGRDANGNLVRCQRTFAGIDAEGNLLLAVSDGRTRSDQGLTLEEMALYMLDKGAVWAINGDGGGSSVIADRSGGINQDENVGANERAVHHALLIFLQPVEQSKDWKQESVEWLNAQGLTDAVRDPDTTPTWAELGAVLRKMMR